MKATAELLLELRDITPAELLLMAMFMHDAPIYTMREYALSLPAPLISDFARALVNAPENTNLASLEVSVLEMIDHEYPYLCDFWEALYGNDDELP